jgi:hypothetical protein
MPRSLEEINRDLRYVRIFEDLAYFLALSNLAVGSYNRVMGRESDAQKKVLSISLEYLNKLLKLREEYEKERKELLSSISLEEK